MLEPSSQIMCEIESTQSFVATRYENILLLIKFKITISTSIRLDFLGRILFNIGILLDLLANITSVDQLSTGLPGLVNHLSTRLGFPRTQTGYPLSFQEPRSFS